MSDVLIQQEGSAVRMFPQGEMTIYAAAELKEKLVAGLRQGSEIELNLADVGEMDTAGFQLLVLLKREAVRLGKHLRLVAHSPATLEVLDRYNMASYFGDPVVLSRQGGERA